MRIVSIVLGLLLLSPVAHAERCWLIGCGGAIGYVYIPSSQIKITPATTNINMNAVRYKLDNSKRLFTEFGLPSIGATVTLNTQSMLFSSESKLATTVQQEIKKAAYIFDKDTRTARLYQYSFDEQTGNAIGEGASLKVLGYIGDALFGSSTLFALVQVESDGPTNK